MPEKIFDADLRHCDRDTNQLSRLWTIGELTLTRAFPELAMMITVDHAIQAELDLLNDDHYEIQDHNQSLCWQG